MNNATPNTPAAEFTYTEKMRISLTRFEFVIIERTHSNGTPLLFPIVARCAEKGSEMFFESFSDCISCIGNAVERGDIS